MYLLGLPDSSVGKEPVRNARDPGWIPGLGRTTGEGIGYPLQYSWASLVAQAGKESAHNAGDLGLIPGLGRSPGEEKAFPLQYSGLDSLDCIAHGVTRSRTRPSDFYFHLFNLYAKHVLRNTCLDESQAGIKIAERNNSLTYVDDTTIMAESEEDLKILWMRVKG